MKRMAGGPLDVLMVNTLAGVGGAAGHPGRFSLMHGELTVSDTPSADSGDRGSSFQAARDAVASAAE